MDIGKIQFAPTSGGETWERLARLAARGDILLHGSRTPGLTALAPATPVDHGPDLYSKSTAVFVTEDPTWAMAYALRDESCQQFLNACFHAIDQDGTWGPRRIFLSYAKPVNGTSPLSSGVVYVVPRGPFARMPPHVDPNLGPIAECQWAATAPIPVLAEVAIVPSDLPIAPLTHDHIRVNTAMEGNPSGFPWLDA